MPGKTQEGGTGQAPTAEPTPAVNASRRLARILVDAEVLGDDELLAIQEQHPNEYLGDVLVKEGILLEGYLQGLLIRTLYVPWVAVERCEIAAELRGLLPEAFCREHRLMPVSRARDFLTVACANPLDEEALNRVREVTGLKVRAVLCAWAQLDALIRATYAPKPVEEAAAEAEGANGGSAGEVAAKTAELAGRLAAQGGGRMAETNGAETAPPAAEGRPEPAATEGAPSSGEDGR